MDNKSSSVVNHLEPIISLLKPYGFSKKLFHNWLEKLKVLEEDDNDFELERLIISLLSTKTQSHSSQADLEIRSLSLLKLFIVLSESISDFSDLKKINQLKRQIESEIEAEKLQASEELLQDHLEKIEVDKIKPIVKVNRSVLPIIAQLILSTFFLLWYNFSSVEVDRTGYLVTFILVSTPIVIFVLKINNYFNKKFNDKQVAVIAEAVKIHNVIGYRGYFLLFLVAVYTVSLLFLLDTSENAIVPYLSFLTIVMPLFFVLSSSVAKLPLRKIKNSIHEKIDLSKTIDQEGNDYVIVVLESKIRAFNSRLEAYILESALFGALAFSGFLTIMAEDLISFEAFENFTETTISFISALLLFEFENLGELLTELTTKTSTFVVVSILSLFSSMFFMVVIASRLRLSQILDKANRSLSLSMVYNEKENELASKLSVEEDKLKLASINQRVTEQLRKSYEKYMEIDDISSFMLIFRAGGVISFFIVLITSAILVSNFLSLFFLFLSLTIVVFFNKKEIEDFWGNLLFKTRISLFYNLHVFIYVGVFVLISSILINYVYSQELSAALLFTCVGVLFTYRLLDLFVVKRSFIAKKVNEVKGLRLFWILAETALLLGTTLFILREPGANFLIAIAPFIFIYPAIAILRIIIKNRFVRFWSVVTSFFINIGLIFKILQFPGATFFMYLGFGSLVLLAVLQLVFKIRFSRLELYFLLIVGAVLGSLVLFPKSIISYQSSAINEDELNKLHNLNQNLEDYDDLRGEFGFEKSYLKFEESIVWFNTDYENGKKSNTIFREGISKRTVQLARWNLQDGFIDSLEAKSLIILAVEVDSDVKAMDFYKDLMEIEE
jgi:hypothetical protein